jgi:hypothetical protein
VDTARADQPEAADRSRLSSGRRFLKFVIVYDNHCQTSKAVTCTAFIFFGAWHQNVFRISEIKSDIII